MAKYQNIGHGINLPLWMSPRLRWRHPAIPFLLFLMIYFYLPTKYKQYLLSSNSSCHVNELSDRKAADDADASVTFLPHIPPKIWQVSILPSIPISDDIFKPPEDAPTWLSLHPSYAYTIVDTAGALAAITRLKHIIPQQYLDVDYLGTEASIHNRKQKLKGNHMHQHQNSLDPVQLYNAIPRPVMKADLVRYALLAAEGGVYSDSDTSPVHPLRQWAPKSSVAIRGSSLALRQTPSRQYQALHTRYRLANGRLQVQRAILSYGE
ncbi:initiation-specific alpha- -mannosyltransferase [Colletotrichum tofieldiae]|nr:initiation-specific alpha- -mannosyltransferase [Colletotrichum tofieldiae]